jgi:hypothetical protein
MSLVLEDDVAYLLLKFGVEDFAGCPATPVPADYADDGAGRSRPDYTHHDIRRISHRGLLS